MRALEKYKKYICVFFIVARGRARAAATGFCARSRRGSAARGRIGAGKSLALVSLAACAAIFLLTGAYAQSGKAGSGSEGIGPARSVHRHILPRRAGRRMTGQCRMLSQEACYPHCNLAQRQSNMRRWNECMRRKRIPGWAPLPMPTR